MSTPTQRITRLIDEGAKLMAQIPGQSSIDMTSEVIAALAESKTERDTALKMKESIKGQ